MTTFGFLLTDVLHDSHHPRNQAIDHLICHLAPSDDQHLNLHRKDRKFAVTYGLFHSVV